MLSLSTMFDVVEQDSSIDPRAIRAQFIEPETT